MEKTTRPFDALFEAINKDVKVELKNEKVFCGKLEAFDVHLNLVLCEAKEKGDEREIKRIVIRGDTIVTIENI